MPEIIVNKIVFVCLAAIVVMLIASGLLYFSRGKINKIAFFSWLTLVVMLCHFPTNAEKGTIERIIFYNADPDIVWLRNGGSAVYSNEVYVAYIPNARLPTTAVVQLWTIAKDAPDGTDWRLANQRPVERYPQLENLRVETFPADDLGVDNCLSNRWCLLTTYIRPSEVVTNGVLHATWIKAASPTNSIWGVPLHTGVIVDGEEIDMMTKERNGLKSENIIDELAREEEE